MELREANQEEVMVALVSRKHGRIFTGSDLGLAEVSDIDDEVHRRHAQGGWSQSRYQPRSPSDRRRRSW